MSISRESPWASVSSRGGFGGGWHRERLRGNLSEFFQELEKRLAMARTNDALSGEDVLAAGGGMRGLTNALSSAVQDALQQ